MTIALLIMLYLVIALVVIGVLYYNRPFEETSSSLEDENGMYILIGMLFPIAALVSILWVILTIPFKIVDLIRRHKCH